MKYLAVTLLVILAVAVQSDAKPKGKDDKHKNKFLIVGDFCVKIQPKSGKITIMRTIEEPDNTTANSVDSAKPVRKRKKRPPCEGLKQITVELYEILEVDASGTEVKPKGKNKHKFKDFSKQDFVVGTPRYAMYQNLEANEVSFSSVVNGANLTLYVYIFNETGNITNGNETKEVTRGTVKFTVKINKWLFCGKEGRRCDKNNTFVDLLLKIKGNRQEKPYNETEKEKKDKEKEEREKEREREKEEKKKEKEKEKEKGNKGEKEKKEEKEKGKKEDDKKDKGKENDKDKKPGNDDKKKKKKKRKNYFCKKRCGRTYYWGEDKVVLFKTVEVDGEMVPMPPRFPVVVQRGNRSLVVLRFPRGKNIIYDPTVEISEEVESQVDDSNNNNDKGGEVGGDGNKDNGSSALSSTSFYAAILLMFALLFQA